MADLPGQVRSMRPDAATALEEMYAAGNKATGKTMVTVSGYRSYAKQKKIYANKLEKVGKKEKADEYVARPGASEHQLGMAMDVGQRGTGSNLNANFGKTASGKWIRENCWQYGFILRYDEGWEDITGYEFEPWHVRYVGKEHAKAMFEQHIPMETYLKDLRRQRLLAIVDSE